MKKVVCCVIALLVFLAFFVSCKRTVGEVNASQSTLREESSAAQLQTSTTGTTQSSSILIKPITPQPTKTTATSKKSTKTCIPVTTKKQPTTSIATTTEEPYEYPEGTSAAVIHNTEMLFREHSLALEEAFKSNDAVRSLDPRPKKYKKGRMFSIAETLELIGVKEIILMQVDVEVDSSLLFYNIQITDTSGKSYYVQLGLLGGVNIVREGDENGKAIGVEYYA